VRPSHRKFCGHNCEYASKAAQGCDLYVLGLAEESVHRAVHQLFVHLNVWEPLGHVEHCLTKETVCDGEDVGLVNDRQEL